jgi:hypothetical protein
MLGKHALLLGSSILLCLCECSCSKRNPVEVAGRVTLAGKPLEDGVVTFRPVSPTFGLDFSGTIVAGEYRVPIRVLPGEYAVDVRSWKKTGKQVRSPSGVDTEETVDAIPERYWGPHTELSAKIVAGRLKSIAGGHSPPAQTSQISCRDSATGDAVTEAAPAQTSELTNL